MRTFFKAQKIAISLAAFAAIACSANTARAGDIMAGEIKPLIASTEPNDYLSAWLRCTAIFGLYQVMDEAKSDPALKDALEVYRQSYRRLVYANIQADSATNLLLLVGREYMKWMDVREGAARFHRDGVACREAMNAAQR